LRDLLPPDLDYVAATAAAADDDDEPACLQLSIAASFTLTKSSPTRNRPATCDKGQVISSARRTMLTLALLLATEGELPII
jgi:hypothetical protein